MAQSTRRRERSYTSFPRNTRQRHLRTCAAEAKQAEQVASETEACYAEYEPVQVFNALDMTFQPVILGREYAKGELRAICADQVRS